MAFIWACAIAATEEVHTQHYINIALVMSITKSPGTTSIFVSHHPVRSITNLSLLNSMVVKVAAAQQSAQEAAALEVAIFSNSN